MTTPTTDQIARALYCATRMAYSLSLGSRNPEAYKAFRDPAPGRMVIESTLGYRNPLNAVGILLRTDREPVEGDFEPDDHPTEKVWYIQTLDGRELRWINAMFLAVPNSLSPP